MKQLFIYADEYIRQSDWKDLAMLKFCLAAIGVLIGVSLPARSRKRASWIAAGIFIITYIPLMAKFLRIVMSKKSE